MTDFELIVVNDGSTDATNEAVHRAAERDVRIRFVEQENRGLAGARNRGIQEAKGSLVAPLDADDTWQPEYLQQMVDALSAKYAGLPNRKIGQSRSIAAANDFQSSGMSAAIKVLPFTEGLPSDAMLLHLKLFLPQPDHGL
jgi:glycosyltransferase involved in cell wall biosynthesis